MKNCADDCVFQVSWTLSSLVPATDEIGAANPYAGGVPVPQLLLPERRRDRRQDRRNPHRQVYIEANWSQQLPDWIGRHVCALAFFCSCIPSCGCTTTCAATCRRPRATSRTSIPPTATWPSITAWRCCQPERAGPRPRSRTARWWLCAGC